MNTTEYRFRSGFDGYSGQYYYACEYRLAGQERWYVIAVFDRDKSVARYGLHWAFYQMLTGT